MVDRSNLARRSALKIAVAAALGGTLWHPQQISAQNQVLYLDDPAYRFQEYEGIVSRPVTVKQLYQWPNFNNPIIYSNVANGLNSFQFTYGVPASDIQVVVQAYYTANAALYDDYIWEKILLRSVAQHQRSG